MTCLKSYLPVLPPPHLDNLHFLGLGLASGSRPCSEVLGQIPSLALAGLLLCWGVSRAGGRLGVMVRTWIIITHGDIPTQKAAWAGSWELPRCMA